MRDLLKVIPPLLPRFLGYQAHVLQLQRIKPLHLLRIFIRLRASSLKSEGLSGLNGFLLVLQLALRY
jgi:hypothetical protein